MLTLAARIHSKMVCGFLPEIQSLLNERLVGLREHVICGPLGDELPDFLSCCVNLNKLCLNVESFEDLSDSDTEAPGTELEYGVLIIISLSPDSPSTNGTSPFHVRVFLSMLRHFAAQPESVAADVIDLPRRIMSCTGAAFCKAYLLWEKKGSQQPSQTKEGSPSPSTILPSKSDLTLAGPSSPPRSTKKPKSFNPPNSRVAILPSHCCVDW